MTHIPLPPHAALSAAAGELSQGASKAERHAISKAEWQLKHGIEILPTQNGFLIPSGTRAGVIHRLDNVRGCDCESGSKGGACWHTHALAILSLAHAPKPAPMQPHKLAAGVIAKLRKRRGLTMPNLIDPPPGDDEPGIGGGEGDEAPDEYRVPSLGDRIAARRRALELINQLF